jgi:arylsulfatase
MIIGARLWGSATGTLRIWAEPFVPLRVPKLYNLRTDPYERADITSNTYYDWFLDHVYLLMPAQSAVGDFLKTFKEFSTAAEGCQLYR